VRDAVDCSCILPEYGRRCNCLASTPLPRLCHLRIRLAFIQPDYVRTSATESYYTLLSDSEGSAQALRHTHTHTFHQSVARTVFTVATQNHGNASVVRPSPLPAKSNKQPNIQGCY
jgi:hypothetical protein